MIVCETFEAKGMPFI